MEVENEAFTLKFFFFNLKILDICVKIPNISLDVSEFLVPYQGSSIMVKNHNDE